MQDLCLLEARVSEEKRILKIQADEAKLRAGDLKYFAAEKAEYCHGGSGKLTKAEQPKGNSYMDVNLMDKLDNTKYHDRPQDADGDIRRVKIVSACGLSR